MRAIIQCHVALLKESWVSVKTWIIRYCQQFLKKIDISSSIGPNKSLKMGKWSLAQASVKWKFVTDVLDYFCHHQGFVFTCTDNNFFITHPIMCEINLSRDHVFMPLCGTLNTIKFIWEVETHVGENFFQFNYQWILKLSQNPHLPITRSGVHLMQNQQITHG